MGEAFIIRRGAAFDAFAVIAVSYPAGSRCTCTNGSKTLKAKDTSGSYLFMIPEAGTWTVTVTDGTKTKSKAVAIERQYQSATISLTFDLVVFENGVLAPEAGGLKYAKDGQGEIDGDGNIYTFISSQSTGAFSTVNSVNISEYNTLFVRLKTSGLTASRILRFGVSTDSTLPTSAGSWNDGMFTALTKLSADEDTFTDHSVNVTSLSDGYIKLGALASTWVSKIWLQ